MATGVGMSFDLEGLDKAIKNAEKGFDNLIKKGQETEKAIVNNFRAMAEDGVGYFANKLNGISSAFENFGKSASKGMQDIASSSSSAVDKVNHLIDMVKSLSYSDYKGQSYSSGAVAKLTYEIEEAMKKLAQLQEKLNFYATGEGAKAIGFYDTSKIVEEANALQRYIELLQQERHELQQIANIKGFQAEQQAKIDAEWQRMEDERIGNIRESAKASSEAAKAESAAWKQSYEEAYRAYERLFDKTDEREYAELFKKAEANLRQMQKAEAERYSDWLLQKKREEDEHKRIEDEKYKSTVEAIAKQNAAYAELEKRRQQNQQVRDNAVQARANYEATIRMYEQMYAQIEAKEKEKERRYLETQKREEEAAARKAKGVIDQANRELEAYRNAYKQRQQMYEQLWNEYDNTPQGALGAYNQLYSPQGVRSLNQMKTVLKQLETAQANINRATKEGQKDWKQVGDAIKRVKSDIESTEKEMGKFHSQQRGILDTSGQLARAMAAVFSVSAIKGYVNKLMQIRGEFELQQRSLQVLLQNKEEANKLWDKTVALAVKSPLTTQQLVTSTKQLAAYRIETEKLYETNKMLADVSQGLGVDMNRLILAFGQVKAANFLRGTELRQFSEAGVNLLDELAKRFSALEGSAVSVAEVFERVSKRQVRFEDVEAVFKTITSKGGTFYQMQEKQSNTLKGMMLNLQDSYELMLNEIGEDNEGMLKGFISIMKSLVDSWRILAPIIKSTGIAFVTYFGSRRILLPFLSFLKKAIDGMKGFSLATAKANLSLTAMWSNFIKMSVAAKASVLGIIAGVVALIWDWVSATDELTQSMSKIDTEIFDSFGESITLYKQLTETINDNSKSIKEQNEALAELKTKFQDILPDEMIQEEYVRNITNGYDEATKAMVAYYNALSVQQKKAKVQEIQGGELDTQTGELLVELKEVLTSSQLLGDVGKEGAAKIKSVLSYALDEAKRELLEDPNFTLEGLDLDIFENIDEATHEKFMKKLVANISKYTGIATDKLKAFTDQSTEWLNRYETNVEDVVVALAKYKEAINDIPDATIVQEGGTDKVFARQVLQIDEYTEKIKNAYSALIDAYKEYRKIKDSGKDTNLAQEDIEKAKTSLSGILSVGGSDSELIKMLDDSKDSAFEFARAINESKAALDELLKTNLGAFNPTMLNSIIALPDTLNKLIKPANKKRNKEIDAYVNNLVEKIGEGENKVYEAFKNIFIKNVSELNDTQKEMLASIWTSVAQDPTYDNIVSVLKAKYEQNEKLLGEVAIARQSGSVWSTIASLFGVGSEQDKKDYDAVQKVLLQTLKQLGADTTKNTQTGGKNDAIQRLKEQISLVRQLADDYEEMSEKYGKFYADQNIKSAERQMQFEQAKLNLKDFAVGTRQDELKNLKKLEEFWRKGKKSKQKEGLLELGTAQAEVQVEIDWEVQEVENQKFAKFIESQFGNYEMTIELEKFNIPDSVAQGLFGFDKIDLTELRNKILNKAGLADLIGMNTEDILGNKAFTNLNKATQDEIRDALNKIDDMELKAQEKRLEKYVKYLEKAQTERVRIRLEEAKQLAEIDETFVMTEDMAKKIGLTDEQWNKYKDIKGEVNKETLKELGLADAVITKILKQNELLREQAKIAKAGVIREANEKEAKARWKAFESSPEIVSMFGNLESMSNKSLRGLRDRIVGLKKDLIESGLPASELKKILEQIAKVEAQISENNPFENFKDSYKNAFDFYKNRKALDDANADMKTKRGELKAAETEFITYQKNASRVNWNINKYNELANAVEEARKKLEDAEKAQVEADNEFKKSQAATQLLSARYKMYSVAINDVTDSLQDMLSALGVLSDEDSEILDGIQSTINNIANVGANIGKIALDPLDIGAWVGAITSLFAVISDIAGTGDAMKERKIQKEVKAVERLTKQYEQLEEAIDRAYSLDTLKESNRLAQENIEQQIQATQRMITLEESKKKTDKDKIQQWRDEMDELGKKQEELTATFLEEVGGVGGESNYKSIAEDFTDAWLNAFYETGDGLTALEENFDEFIKDIVKKQVVQRVAGGLLAPLLQDIDAAAGDGLFDEKEFADVIDKASQIFPEFNERMKETLEAMGMSDWAGKQGELGSLSAGIQGITSEQSDILASYLNSIRFFVADSNMQLKALVAAQGIDADVPNPMLTQLLAIAEQTRAIRDLFDSVVVGGHKMGRSGIKVFID